MQGYLKSRMWPTQGTNELTELLISKGADPEDMNTWPGDVISVDRKHFVYLAEGRKRAWLQWESPCGLLAQGTPGQWWGELQIDGVFHCAENFNPLFACPWPGKKCPYKKKLPPGINCEFHWSEKQYDPKLDIANIEREKDTALHVLYEKDLQDHPGYEMRCMNAKEVLMPDGKWGFRFRWDLHECIKYCRNTCCPARGWKERNTEPVNIFFDVYVERGYEDEYLGMVYPRIEKSVKKGMKVFDNPVARTDAEFALKIWERNPGSHILPLAMDRLNPIAGLGERQRDAEREAYFVEHHGVYNGKRYTIYAELRNIRIAKFEQRDIMQDLEDVRNGIEVIHPSDQTKRAKKDKAERRKQAEIDKRAKQYASGNKGSRSIILHPYISNANDSKNVQKKKDDMLDAIKERAKQIEKKQRLKEEREQAKAGQTSMFD